MHNAYRCHLLNHLLVSGASGVPCVFLFFQWADLIYTLLCVHRLMVSTHFDVAYVVV